MRRTLRFALHSRTTRDGRPIHGIQATDFYQAVGQTWSDHLPLIALGSAAEAVISHRTNDGVHVCMCTLGDTSPPQLEGSAPSQLAHRIGKGLAHSRQNFGVSWPQLGQFTPGSPEPLYPASAAMRSSKASERNGVRTITSLVLSAPLQIPRLLSMWVSRFKVPAIVG